MLNCTGLPTSQCQPERIGADAASREGKELSWRTLRAAREAGDPQSPVSTASRHTEVTSYDWVTAHDYLDLDMDLKPLHVGTKGGM